MATTTEQLSQRYSSFSGADIRVVIDGEEMGSLQALSYASQREKAPIYVLGRVDPLSFSRGKRGIAGTLISLMLDKHPLYHAPFKDKKFVADNDEIYPSATDKQRADLTADLETLDPAGTEFTGRDISDNYSIVRPWYVDQIRPFDIVVIGANEYGNAATMRIYGAEILNEGSGFSVDDMVIESQQTYVCTSILPWQPLGKYDFDTELFSEINDPYATS